MTFKPFLLLLSLTFFSCGLETVTFLNPPLDPSAYLSQSNFTQLTATFTPSNYANTSFQGYEIYYKIYPLSLSTQSANLAADVNLLSVTPTRDYLITLGYQRMNGKNLQATVPPLVTLPTSGTPLLLTLDFSSLIGLSQIPTHLGTDPLSPVPTVWTTGESVPVYRTVTSSTGTVVYPYFNELFDTWSIWGKTSDMSGTITQATTPYEIDVFLVAYAFTLEATTYSQPEPWGVLQPMTVP